MESNEFIMLMSTDYSVIEFQLLRHKFDNKNHFHGTWNDKQLLWQGGGQTLLQTPSLPRPRFKKPNKYQKQPTTYKKVERQTKSKEYTKNHAKRNHFVTWMMVEFHWKSG